MMTLLSAFIIYKIISILLPYVQTLILKTFNIYSNPSFTMKCLLKIYINI